MSRLTRIPGCPDRDDIVPGMAHWPLLEPSTNICDGCKHVVPVPGGRKGKSIRCRLYSKMMGGAQGAAFYRGQKACKYWERP